MPALHLFRCFHGEQYNDFCGYLGSMIDNKNNTYYFLVVLQVIINGTTDSVTARVANSQNDFMPNKLKELAHNYFEKNTRMPVL